MKDRKFRFKNENGYWVANAYYTKCGGVFTLVSYTTRVCKIWYEVNGGVTVPKFERIGYGDYYDSPTTMRHINMFRFMHGLTTITKREWNQM